MIIRRHRASRGRSLSSILVALIMMVAATAAASAARCPPPPYPDMGLFDRPDNGAPEPQLLAYGCSGRYARDLAGVLEEARAFVEWRAGAGGPKPALVLDIDETSLSNWRQMLANDFAFIATGPCRIDRGGPCSQQAWELMAAAAPIAPTVALFKAARARGVAVFFITGRDDTPARRAAAVRNLHRAGYRGWTALVMRAPNEHGLTAEAYKSQHRAAITAAGYTIIASVGDQWSDLDGGYAERTFKLPNPFYFIP